MFVVVNNPSYSFSDFFSTQYAANCLAILLQMLMNASLTMVDVPMNVSIWRELIVVSVLGMLFTLMDMIAVSSYSYAFYLR